MSDLTGVLPGKEPAKTYPKGWVGIGLVPKANEVLFSCWWRYNYSN